MEEQMVEIRRYSILPVMFQWSLVLITSCCVAIVGCLLAKQSVDLGAAIGVAIFLLLFRYAEPSPAAILVCPETKTLHTRVFFGKSRAPVDIARFRYVRARVVPPEVYHNGFSVILELLTDIPGEHYVVCIFHSLSQSMLPSEYHETAACKKSRLLLIEHLGVQDVDEIHGNTGWLPSPKSF